MTQKRGRPKLFPCCPECGEDALSLTGTRLQGHVINRWCVCSICGAHNRWIQAGEHGHWVRVREINSPENTSTPCM